MKIPEPIVEYIQCLTPAHLLAISSAIDSEALKALNAGDMEKAISMHLDVTQQVKKILWNKLHINLLNN